MRVSPPRIRAGRSATLSWELPVPAARTDVTVYRAARGVWRDVGRVHGPAAAGRNALALGARWAGRRIRPGRHRLELRAVAPDGALSRARSVAVAFGR